MTTRTIRALTILQPWAHLIVRGRKRVAYGAVVGVARLAGVEDEAPEDEAYWCGPWGWRLDEVRAIEPVPCKGAQGLWTLPPEVLATVRARWSAARKGVTHVG